MNRKLCFIYIIVIGFITLIISFSPKANYKVLSTIFDGVPNPYALDSIRIADSISKSDSTYLQQILEAAVKNLYVYHPPYQEKECATCHDQNVMGKLLQPEPGLCYQCHDDFAQIYMFIHGPVSSGFCTECHSPHMAENEKLLLRTGQGLCLYCHQSEQVFKNESHSGIEDTNCTDCHNPHAGYDNYFLN